MTDQDRTRCWLYGTEGTLELIDLPAPTDPLDHQGRKYSRWPVESAPDSGPGRAKFFLYTEGEQPPSLDALARARVADDNLRRRERGRPAADA
jgi:hypothetical protein